MSVVDTPKSQGLIARVMGIITRPNTEWDLIAAEPATVQGLFTSYAAILAAIPALAQIVVGLMPHCFLVVCTHSNPIFVVVAAVAYYLISLVEVFVIGFLIDALAPSFGGERSQIQAMKVAVYSWTAAWLAGIFVIIPWLGILLSLLGLYSLYLLYLGLGKVMKSPADKQIIYTIVVVVVAFVVFLVGGAVVGTVSAIGAISGGITSPAESLSGTTVTVPGGGGANVDLGKLQAAAQAASQQLKDTQTGGPAKVTPVDPEKLKALMPGDLGGVPRTDLSASTASAGGIGGSDVEATYQTPNGDTRITLKVVDLAAMGGFAAMAGAMNVHSDEQSDHGYKKVDTINGRLTTEEYDTQAKSGSYTVVVANRFSVEADGSNVSMDAIKAAVAAVGPDRLESLAHG